MIKLTRPLIVFDLETTGLDFQKDRIIQIAIIKKYPGTNKKPLEVVRYVNPGFKIPPEAVAIHGITDEDVKDAKTFKEMAPGIAKFIKGCDVVGYNSNRFDVPFLQTAFERAEIYDALNNVEFIDVFNLYCKFNPRTLSQAYADYCGKQLKAHKADADAKATIEVLEAIIDEHKGEINAHNLEGPTVKNLAEMSRKSKKIDILGCIVENEKGTPVFSFGKHKNKAVTSQRTYCKWLLDNDGFTENTKQHIKQILNAKT